MSILEAILPRKGIIPARPRSLSKPPGVETDSTLDAVVRLIEQGKAVAFGGVSIIGKEGCLVYVIGLLKVNGQSLQGWMLYIDHPEKDSDFNFIDSSRSPLNELPFPNTITYFVAEADESLIRPDAPQQELQDIARFVVAFISDDGPPEGIDWK